MPKTKKTKEELLINCSLTAEEKALFDSSSTESESDEETEGEVDYEQHLSLVPAVGRIKTFDVCFICLLSYFRFISANFILS